MTIKNEIIGILRQETHTADPDLEASHSQINFLAILLMRLHNIRTDEDLNRLRDDRSSSPSLTRKRASDEITEIKHQLGE